MTEYDEIIDHLTDVVIQAVHDGLLLDVQRNRVGYTGGHIDKLENLMSIRGNHRTVRKMIEKNCDEAEEWRLELQDHMAKAAREKLTGETNPDG